MVLHQLLRIWLTRLAWFLVMMVVTVLLSHLRTAYVIEDQVVTVGTMQRTVKAQVWSWAEYSRQLREYKEQLRRGEITLRTRSGAEVSFLPLLKTAGWNSFQLMGLATAIAVIAGIALGCLIVVRNRLLRALSLSWSVLGLSLPDFMVVVVLQFVTIYIYRTYNVKLWLVGAEPGSLAGWFVPLTVLSLAPLGMMTRLTSAAMHEIMHEDYIRTARGKGVPAIQVVAGHALRNVFPRILTALPGLMNLVLSSMVVVERLTNWPGLTQWIAGEVSFRTWREGGETISVWIGATPPIVSTAAILFVAWFLFVDGMGRSLRVVWSPAQGEGRA